MTSILNAQVGQPQHLIVIDEAMLRTIVMDVVTDALAKVKNEKPSPYTRADVMDILHIKETSLWLLQQNGTLHPFKVGGKMLFDRSEVDAVAQGRKRGASC